MLLGSFLILLILLIPVGCIRLNNKANKDLLLFPVQYVDSAVEEGRSLAYRQAGNSAGQRVIYIHGSPGDAGAWINYLKNPIAEYNHLAVDRLGYGESITSLNDEGKPLITAVLSYKEQAEAIAPLLEEKSGKWPIVVGHSLGGPIAAQLAADYPEKVGGLLILAGSLDPAFEEPRWYTQLFASSLTRWLLPGSLKQSNREMLATLAETQALQQTLANITCPVIVLHGADDTLVPSGNLEFMRQNFTNAHPSEFILLPNQGHFLPWQQEGLVRELILKLSTLQPSPENTPATTSP